MSYDSHGRLDVLTYPASTGDRFAVQYGYDFWGSLSTITDIASNTVYYTLNEADAVGRDVLVHLGNGLDEYREFDRASGNLAAIQTGPSLGSSIQDLSFAWYEAGNLDALFWPGGIIEQTPHYLRK